MSNFDFLKNFNDELYKIGVKLEEDVINSPRAVTADATLFLETLVKDIYKQSQNKLETNLMSFYKKIDNLYRLGVITYIYKNKLQDAYNLRNKIHKSNLDVTEEVNLAYDLHKRLYFISKKYFQDYCENERYINIPEYSKPQKKDIKFDNCIICGKPNRQSLSNMCSECNQKIDNANLLLSIKNTLTNNNFTKQDLLNSGISESETIALLMGLTKSNIIIKNGNHYTFNEENFKRYITQIDQYIEIGLLLSRFYKNEISSVEIKKSKQYLRGSKNQKPYIEFYNLVNVKLEKTFEEELIKTENIKRSIKKSYLDDLNIKNWFAHETKSFIDGSLNDAFILYNELLIKEFFSMKRRGLDDEDILKHLEIPYETYEFWQKHFMGKDFMKKTSEIKKDLILKEVKKNKTLDEALKSAGVSRKEFEKLYIISKNYNDNFSKEFNKEYTQKRQKLVLKHLKNSDLNSAVRKSRVSRTEFLKWYYRSEHEGGNFYIQATGLLMDKYLKYRKNGLNKKEILKKINISRDMFESWSRHNDLKLFRDFEEKNKEITSFLVKRGIIINALKDDKSKEEAIFSADLTPREFMEIYNSSKREKTEFYIRFDREYMLNRKRLFMKLIKENDFFNAINKCEISQIDFNRWYLKDQDRFISDYHGSEFYITTTTELMNKYIKARLNGKNKPDAARCVGLSNIIINKWLNHPEYELYYEFKKRVKQLNIDLIVRGFRQGKSKVEVSKDCDIPIKTIEEYINFGRNGFMKYEELFELYEKSIVPSQLEIFLKDFKSKSFNKSVKNAKISKEDLQYYYNHGREDEESEFNNFYKDYLSLKIRLYIDNMIARKSHKISLKNSKLTEEELNDNRDFIDGEILYGRMCVAGEELVKHKTTGAKLAKKVGVSVDEIYSWYFKGKKGEKNYKEFYLMFELGIVLPRLKAYEKALEMNIPRKWLNKKLKKDLGNADYKIWDKNGLISGNVLEDFHIYEDDDDIDSEKIINMMKNSSSTVVDKEDNPELFNFIKKCIGGKEKIKGRVNVSKKDVQVLTKQVLGNS